MKTWSVANFWWLWSVSALIGAGVLCVFASLCARNAVSSDNIIPWCAILLALAGVVGGSLWLRSAGHGILATVPLWLLIAPVILSLAGTLAFAAFYFLVFLFGKGRMN